MKRLIALLLCLLLPACALGAENGFAVRNGDRARRRVCITVDDCADTDILRQMYELGQSLDVPITFFTLGYVLKDEDAELWRTVAESNCEIGNHTYWHKSMPKLTHQEMVSNLTQVQERLDELLGYHYPMQVMRPPYGNIRLGQESNYAVVKGVRAAGYTHAVLWDVCDSNPATAIKHVQNGSILLYHTLSEDLECLKVLLPALKEQGYAFVTVSEMLGMEPVQIVR